jgi:UDP-N-acetylglucosamine 2-epimerase (non-hydrolysing)
LQEEAPAVGTPVLVVGGAHRQEAVEAGCVRPVPAEPIAIADHAISLLDHTMAYERMRRAPNPFGDGAAAGRVSAALEHLIFDSPPPAPFGVSFSRRKVLEAAGFSETDVSAAESTRAATLVPIGRSRV